MSSDKAWQKNPDRTGTRSGERVLVPAMDSSDVCWKDPGVAMAASASMSEYFNISIR